MVYVTGGWDEPDRRKKERYLAAYVFRSISRQAAHTY